MQREVGLERRGHLVAEGSDAVQGEVCGGEILASSWCSEISKAERP